MPNLHIPIRSGPHRIAAIALYRALLTQCRAVQLERAQRDELQNIVRNRFKQARHSQSTRRLRISFQAGYEAIDHLDAAVAGDGTSTRYIAELVENAPGRIKLPPGPYLPSKKSEKQAKSAEEHETVTTPTTSIFDRPLPLEKLSGKRHIPILFNANHIPVLRIKKPQPASLSRFLRQRIEQRQSRHDRRWMLYSEKEIAKREDEWDDLVGVVSSGAHEPNLTLGQAMNTNASSVEMEEPLWTKAVEEAIDEVQSQLDEEREKNRIMAEKMQAVVDRETEAFEIERKDRLRVRRREYRQRRNERSGKKQTSKLEDRVGASETAGANA